MEVAEESIISPHDSEGRVPRAEIHLRAGALRAVGAAAARGGAAAMGGPGPPDLSGGARGHGDRRLVRALEPERELALGGERAPGGALVRGQPGRNPGAGPEDRAAAVRLLPGPSHRRVL